MEVLIFIVIVFTIAMAAKLVFDHQWQSVLLDVARRFGLVVEDNGLARLATMRGDVGGASLTVELQSEYVTDEGFVRHTCIVLTPSVAPVLTVLPRYPSRPDDTDFEVGDEMFDAEVVVRGPLIESRALLDQETRATVRAAIANGVSVEDGSVRWATPGRANAATIVEGIGAVRNIARLLSRPADDVALAQVVRTDDEAGVAVEALRAMRAGNARDVLDAEIVASRNDRLVMAVAARMGVAAASGVQRVLENPENWDELRASAMIWLGRHTDAANIARAHLRRPLIAKAALEVLNDAAAPAPLDALAGLMDGDPTVASLAVEAATRHGAAAEPLLLAALRANEMSVACAAAVGLSKVGSPAAVIPLREKAKGLFADRTLKSAALAAIESIHERVGVAKGGLSMVDASAAGRLSEAE